MDQRFQNKEDYDVTTTEVPLIIYSDLRHNLPWTDMPLNE